MHLFNRTISVKASSEDFKIVRVDGLFLDTRHELCMTLEVDANCRVITAASGQFCRAPHGDCDKTAELFNALIGINLTHNVRRQVIAAVGQKEGCTHIVELTLECIRGFLQATYNLMQLSIPEEEVRRRVEQQLEGTCYHYQKRLS